MPGDFQKPKNFYQIPDITNLTTNELKTTIIGRKTQKLNLRLNVYKQGFYILPIAYFPAWKGTLDDNDITLLPNKHGISVNLPKGEHNLMIEFKQTPIEILGNLVSIAGILILIAGIIRLKPKYE